MPERRPRSPARMGVMVKLSLRKDNLTITPMRAGA